MILRIERTDQVHSTTVNIDEAPEIGDILDFNGRFYVVGNVVEFSSHTLALVKEVIESDQAIKIFKFQVLDPNDYPVPGKIVETGNG